MPQGVEMSFTTEQQVVISNLRQAAQRVLADREGFLLDSEALAAWEAMNQAPALSLKGLQKLMGRPSPFDG